MSLETDDAGTSGLGGCHPGGRVLEGNAAADVDAEQFGAAEVWLRMWLAVGDLVAGDDRAEDAFRRTGDDLVGHVPIAHRHESARNPGVAQGREQLVRAGLPGNAGGECHQDALDEEADDLVVASFDASTPQVGSSVGEGAADHLLAVLGGPLAAVLGNQGDLGLDPRRLGVDQGAVEIPKDGCGEREIGHRARLPALVSPAAEVVSSCAVSRVANLDRCPTLTRSGPYSAAMRFSDLTRSELAALVPELLLCGHLIDRSGMPHLIGAFGREGMRDIAIEEWMGASPVYTRRMQHALGFEADTVETIFKGMQLDIGAPPQFMDFRYRLESPYRGEFWLDHCGALMDVEPMGDDYVTAMCHDIEDPTFDATAIATNRRAQVRPIHRPPRVPTDRHPHCAWTVVVDPSHPELPIPSEALAMGQTRAAVAELSPIDPDEHGRSDYSGPLLDDLRFDEWSRSALVRMAEEICLQGHLLTLSFLRAVRRRTTADEAVAIGRHQFCGIAGLAAERIRALFDLGDDAEALMAVLDLHPASNPRPYVGLAAEVVDDGVRLSIDRACDAVVDGAWLALLGGDDISALDAIARAVNQRFVCRVVEDCDRELVVIVRMGETERPESSDVALTRFSTGAAFEFRDRGVPVEIGARA